MSSHLCSLGCNIFQRPKQNHYLLARSSFLIVYFVLTSIVNAQDSRQQTDLRREASPTIMANIPGRKLVSLNGKWKILIDPNDAGVRVGVPKDTRPKGKTDFLEY